MAKIQTKLTDLLGEYRVPRTVTSDTDALFIEDLTTPLVVPAMAFGSGGAWGILLSEPPPNKAFLPSQASSQPRSPKPVALDL